MSRVRLPIRVALLIIAIAATSPVDAQTKAATGSTSGGGGSAGAAGGANESGGSGTTPTTTTAPSLEVSPYGSVPGAPPLQVIDPTPPVAAPSADSGTTGCQCYRTERVPMIVDGQTSWSERSVPSGTSPTCCP